MSLTVFETLFAVGLGVFGLVLGSFLNVVIARVPEGLSIVRPRSRCPKCGHQLAWYENIPVFSFLVLGGKCRGCKAPISWQYPLVELLTAGLFLLCLWRFDWTWSLVLALMLVVLLIPLTFIDLAHWILPLDITRPGIALGILLSIPLGTHRVIESVVGALVGFLVFLALEYVGAWIFKQEALGAGDKWLLALIGAFLTYRPLLGVIFFASLQGGVIGAILIAVRGRAGPAAEPREQQPTVAPEGPPQGEAAHSEEEDDWEPGPTNIPFGPWLALSALELLFLGHWISAHLPLGVGWMISGS